MAQLYFYYGSMNSSKTTSLIQAAYNYQERKMHAIILKPVVDNREGAEAFVRSRIGASAPAILFNPKDDLLAVVKPHISHTTLNCVLVDEAQFLTRAQVEQLCVIVDSLHIPVLCYGLRTDFQGNLFTGSQWLLARADKLSEVKGVCHCGSKATHVLRYDDQGCVVTEGAQILVGGNDRYEAVCRKHFQLAHVQRKRESRVVSDPLASAEKITPYRS